MSQSVERLKELLFNTETHALEELARRIDGLAEADDRTRSDLTRHIETVASSEAQARDALVRQIATVSETDTRARSELIRHIESRIAELAESDARARHEIGQKIEEVYARVGNAERLTASVADILSDALRRAEIAKHLELSQTIAPLVVTTIKAELRNSQDEMVEALYPITGRLVKSYVASAIKDLTDEMNRRLEQNPVMLRLQSLTTGRSVGELALAGTQDFDVKELYLIRRGSGELVAHWPDNQTSGREHAMSGVLAAVNEFANEAFSADQSSLRQIDLGGEEVYLRGSPVYLLAARCSGQAPKSIEQTLDDAFLSAVEAQHRIDAVPTAGDHAAEKAAALAELGTSLKADVSRQLADFKRPGGSGALKMLAALILLPVIGWYGWGWYTDYRIASVRSAAERIVAADPAMLGYPAQIDVTDAGRSVTVSGLTPSQQAKARIVEDIKRSLPRVALSDRLSVVAGSGITVPDMSPELARVRQEMSTAVATLAHSALTRTNTRAQWRLTQATADLERAAAAMAGAPEASALRSTTAEIAAVLALSQSKTLAETTSDHDDVNAATFQALANRLNISAGDLVKSLGGSAALAAGTTSDSSIFSGNPPLGIAAEQFAANAERIAALATTIAVAKSLKPAPQPAPAVQPQQPSPHDKLEAFARRHAIFFAANTDFRNTATASKTLSELAALMKAAPALVRLVGYTDEVGAQPRNLQLAQERADKVRRDLISAGIPASQLVAVGRANAIDLSDSRGADSPNRRVEFEIGFEGEAQQ